jgi:hypothetical protein
VIKLQGYFLFKHILVTRSLFMLVYYILLTNQLQFFCCLSNLDSTKLLQWKAKDRAVVAFANIHDVQSKKEVIQELVKKWLEATVQHM